MRIIAGQYRGRSLSAPKGRDVRPTSDKVRESIFSILGARIDLEGLQVLDVFCGTGALGLEALSRGAAHCVFIDKSSESLSVARYNAQNLGVPAEAVQFIKADAASLKQRTALYSAGTGNSAGSAATPPQAADLFFCDPPYKKGLIAPCLQALAQGDYLAAGALGILEAEKGFNANADIPDIFEILQHKKYGDTEIFLVEKSS
ncbi:MAG: 16S rRNA (guanine(966)-N(2))-methyltransferase RsmD [Alphaproteobacteria bacterium]